MAASLALYPADYLTRPNPLMGKQLRRTGAKVIPADLQLSRTAMQGTFGRFEDELAVQALLEPSRACSRWRDVSWLKFAAPFGWSTPLMNGGGLLPGYLASYGPGIDPGLSGVVDADLPRELVMPAIGLHLLVSRELVEWFTVYVGEPGDRRPLSFFRVKAALIVQLLHQQSRNPRLRSA